MCILYCKFLFIPFEIIYFKFNRFPISFILEDKDDAFAVNENSGSITTTKILVSQLYSAKQTRLSHRQHGKTFTTKAKLIKILFKLDREQA